jgi:hypothetical protein
MKHNNKRLAVTAIVFFVLGSLAIYIERVMGWANR